MTTTTNIRKVARVHDKSNNNYLEVIEFPVSDIQAGRIELPPSEVSDLKIFTRKLRDAGAVLDKDKERLKQQLESVAKSDPPEQWIYEDHTGWMENYDAFVTINGVIGNNATDIIGVNQSKAIKDRSGQLSLEGSWKAWRDTVGELARNSTTLTLSISAALGAPLIGISGIQPFSVNLFGPPRAGKSMAALAAGSVIGIGRQEDLISWKITNARLEERLPEFNDGPMPIDDLEKIGGKAKVKYQRIRDTSYGVSQGFATAKYSGHTRSHQGAHKGWRSIVLTSCEKSVKELAHSAKTERQHGEAVRLIDVPAVYDGSDHIFDRLPAERRQTEDWRERTFAALAQACEKNHGRPFRKYIKSLIKQRATLKGDVVSHIDSFVARACDKFDGAIARDVARKFGVMYAGGLFGIQCGLLPWKEEKLREAIVKSFLAAKEFLPDKGAFLRSGLATLKAARRQLPKISDPPKGRDLERDYASLRGYRFSTVNEIRSRIRFDVYSRLFASSEQRDAVTNWLIEKSHITLAKPKKGQRRPQDQFVWPDGSRTRSIELVFKKKKRSSGDKPMNSKKRK